MQFQSELNIASGKRARDLPQQRAIRKMLLGVPKLVWLKALKNSARNSIPSRSFNLEVLDRFKSTFWKAGPSNEFRPMFPRVPESGITNAFGSNQCSLVWLNPDGTGSEITLARSVEEAMELPVLPVSNPERM